MDILEGLNEEILCTLTKNIDTKQLISESDTYIKIVEQADGSASISESTLAEYLYEQSQPSIMATNSNSWMRIHTTIIEKDANYAEVSAAYTWLTRPALRMRDVVGLSLTQGTVVANSASGFYSYTTSLGSKSINFTSGFHYEGHGITKTQTLAKPDVQVLSDYLFLRADIIKEGNSEGLNGSYGHQRLSLSLSPGFTIDRKGFLSAIGINFGMYYDQFKGYESARWRK